jgi:hypothetical protein
MGTPELDCPFFSFLTHKELLLLGHLHGLTTITSL